MFDGVTFDKQLDGQRLGTQLEQVRDVMSDGRWRSLEEISRRVGCQTQSVSARLRDLRKPKFGSYVVKRKRVGGSGLHLYKLEIPVRHDEQLELLEVVR
tara:strand:+ start:701 stop:997 length:297 start_codon:yes stop_codon:yes gene_type:complete